MKHISRPGTHAIFISFAITDGKNYCQLIPWRGINYYNRSGKCWELGLVVGEFGYPA